MTTADLQYPVRYCHFCDQIMFYNRYENGEHYAYCNSHMHLSCMGFSYRVIDGAVTVKEFALAHTDILYFKMRVEKDSGEPKSYLLISSADGNPHCVTNLVVPNLQIVLDKQGTRKLLEKIRKAILLLD